MNSLLQLKTGIRIESLKQPLKKAIETSARIGADAVEINARSELRPQDLTRTAVRHLKKMLGDLNLQVCGLRYPTRRAFHNEEDLDRRLDATRKAMLSAYELGARVVVGSADRIPNAETEAAQYQLFLAAMSDLARHGQRVGVFFAIETRSIDTESARQLMSELPVGIGFDFDPACFLMNNLDSGEFLRINGESVLQMRARDAVRDLSQGRAIEVTLGRGSIDFPQTFGLLEEKSFNGFVVLEQNVGDDPMGDMSNGIQYLKSFF